jgi:N-methylhydantoinase A
MGHCIGVDIGGTFTDCVAVDEDGRVFHAKTLSTHATNPADGVLEGIERLADAAGRPVEEFLAGAERLGHGTTIGTNLVAERKGARVGLLATAGHGDALLLMRGAGRTAGVPIDQVYSVHTTDKPVPIVPRGRIAEVHERVAVDGAVVVPMDEEGARAAVAGLLEAGDVDAVAIALMWSFRNPEHERRLRALVAEHAPDAYVSISSEVSPRQGEYERTVATVINSYVGPRSAAYLDELQDRLAARGLTSPPLVMQANGGVVPIAAVKSTPLAIIGSGPTGGLAGSAALARAHGHRNVIATDMGGTTFDVGLAVDGEPLIADERVIAQYTYNAPHLDVRSIACGGGSIARYDEHTHAITVGPESAGSDPGPACYGRGGEQPTVTDADVVLGLLRADGFLEGRMPLDAGAARRAVASVGEPAGLSVEEAAAGILRINNMRAATLIRQRTLEQGLDPRDFAIYAFGGAGPLHAFGYAPELGAREVVVPLGNGASTLSAYGIASSDIVRYFERECRLTAPFDAAELAAVVAAVEEQARAALAEQGLTEDVLLERTALMRYAEQYLNSLPAAIGDGPIDEATGTSLAEQFDAEYGRLYGEGAKAIFQAVEIFTVRVRARVPLRVAAAQNGHAPGGTQGADLEPRQVFWPTSMAFEETRVLDGTRLEAGAELDGPAVVELPHTTVAVAAGQRLRHDPSGDLVLTVA